MPHPYPVIWEEEDTATWVWSLTLSNDATGAPQPFIIPTFLGILVVMVGGNQAAREEELCVFSILTHTWQEYSNVTNALQKQLLLTVEETC
jgi:hypothetical protein